MSTPESSSVKRVFLVDDHPLVRERLAQLIDQQPDLKVCGEAGDVPEALDGLERTKPDVAVVDLSLKNSNGLELSKDIKARGWDIPVLVLSMHEEMLYAERVLRAGGLGYLSKQESSREILLGIRKVIQGQVHVSGEVAGLMLRRIAGGQGKPKGATVECLADRELQVFQLIGHGNSTRKIAETLNLSVKTVESYRARIKEKLLLDDGVQLLQRAVTWVESGGGREGEG
jgi:DNA-binding NarL/FixJ family response regulator